MMSMKAYRMLYFPYVHSVISYGIIFGGNNPNSIKLLRIENKY